MRFQRSGFLPQSKLRSTYIQSDIFDGLSRASLLGNHNNQCFQYLSSDAKNFLGLRLGAFAEGPVEQEIVVEKLYVNLEKEIIFYFGNECPVNIRFPMKKFG